MKNAERVRVEFVGDSAEKIFGLMPRARTLEALRALGVIPTETGSENLPSADFYLLIRGDHLFDPRLLAALLQCHEPCLLVTPGPGEIALNVEGHRVVRIGQGAFAWVGLARLSGPPPEPDLQKLLRALIESGKPLRALDISGFDDYVPKLRRHVPFYRLAVRSMKETRQAERMLIASSEKDPSDLMAKYLHRPIENWAVAHLARTSITPNQLTVAINVMAYTATALFATGHLLSASLLTFVVGLIDGFDGKLARVKGLASRVGSLEHAFDLLFESSWILALGYDNSVRNAGIEPLLLAGLSVAVIAFYRSIYERFGQVAEVSLDVCDRFGNLFRRVAGRRNLYNIEILIFVLIHWPLGALFSITIHAAVTALVYGARAWWKLRRLDR